ncbi:hypothetical protein ABIE71_002225 [Bradyrhizobium diazoefficiens]
MDQSKPDAVPDYLLWVKDAPLFIDELNLGRFYDAALRPPFDENAPVKLKLSDATKEDIKNKYGAKGSVGLANWLSIIASSSVEAAAEREKTKSHSKGSETEIVLQPITTPHRQLEQLTIFYLLERANFWLEVQGTSFRGRRTRADFRSRGRWSSSICRSGRSLFRWLPNSSTER